MPLSPFQDHRAPKAIRGMQGKKASLESLDYLDFEVMEAPGGTWTYQEGKGLPHPSLTFCLLLMLVMGLSGQSQIDSASDALFC